MTMPLYVCLIISTITGLFGYALANHRAKKAWRNRPGLDPALVRK